MATKPNLTSREALDNGPKGKDINGKRVALGDKTNLIQDPSQKPVTKPEPTPATHTAPSSASSTPDQSPANSLSSTCSPSTSSPENSPPADVPTPPSDTATSTKLSSHDLNIDEEDKNDAQSLVDYVNDIYDHLFDKEKLILLTESFANKQTEISEKMRSILVDWLVEVHRMFKLLPETLFLAVYLTDKFLRMVEVKKDQLQLVGISAMFISSKYEEIYAPECNDFVYISDGAYTKKKILEMETLMLNTLGFHLTVPVSLLFLRRFSKAAGSDYVVHNLCKYIIETMLLDPKIHSFPPSLVAASSVYISRKMTENPELWNPTLEHYSKYSEAKVKKFAQYVNVKLIALKRTGTLKAIEKKYASEKFGSVACIPLVDI